MSINNEQILPTCCNKMCDCLSCLKDSIKREGELRVSDAPRPSSNEIVALLEKHLD